MKIKEFQSKKEFAANLYVLTEDDSAIIIDPGFFDERIIKYLENYTLKGILITHGHFDHINGINEIHKQYPETKIYVGQEDEKLLTNPHYNGSIPLLNKNIKIDSVENIVFLSEFEKIGPFNFEVITLPGHSKGSVGFYFKKDNILFIGDTIIGYSIGRTDLFGGSIREMKDSLEKLKKYGFNETLKIYSGHDEMTLWGYQLKYNPYLK